MNQLRKSYLPDSRIVRIFLERAVGVFQRLAFFFFARPFFMSCENCIFLDLIQNTKVSSPQGTILSQ
jgi:hypothetical protein